MAMFKLLVDLCKVLMLLKGRVWDCLSERLVGSIGSDVSDGGFCCEELSTTSAISSPHDDKQTAELWSYSFA